MKLPSQIKILREDVKGAPEWVDRLIGPFNSLAETIYQAMNRNLTFSENIACFLKEITYKTTSAYPVAENITFTNALRTKAVGCWVVQAYDRSNYEPAPGPCYVPWVENNGTIVVGPITGLQASKIYTIRLIVI